MHPAAVSFFLDGIGSLLLGADKQDFAAVCRNVTDKAVSLVQLADGLLQVDDVDAVSLGEDIRRHLGVPSSGLMTKVYASFQELLHRYYCHSG